MSAGSPDDPRVLFVPRASCGHGQRLPEPAVWFQGVLSLWRVIPPTADSPKMPPFQLPQTPPPPCYLHFILGIIPVVVFCVSLKCFRMKL